MKFTKVVAILLSMSVLCYTESNVCRVEELAVPEEEQLFSLERKLNSDEVRLNQELISFVLETKEKNYEEYTDAIESIATVERGEHLLVQSAALEEAIEMMEDRATAEKAAQEVEMQQSRKEERQIFFQEEQQRLEQDIYKANKFDMSVEEYRICMSSPENVPKDNPACKSDKKTYMDYRSVTHTNTDQYKLLNSKWCYTDNLTGIRMFDGRYCIAVGSYYTTKIGTKIDVVLENGNILRCVLGDCKSDSHTDAAHQYHVGGWDNGKYWPADGSVVEFVVDRDIFDSKGTGMVTYSSMQGSVSKVVVLNDEVEF